MSDSRRFTGLVTELVLASGNAGKRREIEALLLPLGIRLVSQTELGIAEAEEPYHSFLENALAKARHASRESGRAALADDSGLCVRALQGAPGVQSAYFAGNDGDRETRDRRNNAKLLAELATRIDRRAYYACVMVLVRHADDPFPIVASGTWHGQIATAPRGEGGFGYDPYFVPTGVDRTAAELPPQEKNARSHRGKALTQMLAALRDEDGLT